MYFYLWFLFEIFDRDSIYDILKQKNHKYTKFGKKTWTKKHVMNFWMA